MAKTPSIKKRQLRPSRSQNGSKPTTKKKVVPLKTTRQANGLSQLFRAVGHALVWLARHTIPRYFRQAFKTLREVTWPNFKETRQLTTAVLLFAAVFSALIAFIDLGLDKVFKRILLK